MWGWVALALGAGLATLGRALNQSAPGGLARALPEHARKYASDIAQAAQLHGVPPLLLAAVLEQESDYGEALAPKGPGGKGDGGHGHGVGQIDDRTWGAWLRAHRWYDFLTNATKAAEILAAGLKAFPGNLRAGVSAYNAGPANVRKALSVGRDPGAATTVSRTGETYPDAVLRRLSRLTQKANS